MRTVYFVITFWQLSYCLKKMNFKHTVYLICKYNYSRSVVSLQWNCSRTIWRETHTPWMDYIQTLPMCSATETERDVEANSHPNSQQLPVKLYVLFSWKLHWPGSMSGLAISELIPLNTFVYVRSAWRDLGSGMWALLLCI